MPCKPVLQGPDFGGNDVIRHAAILAACLAGGYRILGDGHEWYGERARKELNVRIRHGERPRGGRIARDMLGGVTVIVPIWAGKRGEAHVRQAQGQ